MNEQTNITYRTQRLAPRARPGELRWLDMSFTTEGLDILQSFRHELMLKEGRSVSLGYTLDVFLKSYAAAPEAK